MTSKSSFVLRFSFFIREARARAIVVALQSGRRCSSPSPSFTTPRRQALFKGLHESARGAILRRVRTPPLVRALYPARRFPRWYTSRLLVGLEGEALARDTTV
jgi:hypothetical protein